MPRTSSDQLADNPLWINGYMSGHILHVHPAQVRSSSVPEQQHQLFSTNPHKRSDDPHDDAHPEGENSNKMAEEHRVEAFKAVNEIQESQHCPLIESNLLYLKKGNSGPEKIVLSLHKFPAIVFNDDDIEEQTFRLVNKCIKKFNPYARYGVENWKNPHAKIFYI
ncbi:hypothetical protein Tco_0807841 [Tanacetum coccineum]